MYCRCLLSPLRALPLKLLLTAHDLICWAVTACDCDHDCWQDFEAKGGKVVVPVGCNGLEDWLLDNIEVTKLMPLLKKGAATTPRQNVQASIEVVRPQEYQGA